MTKILMLDKSTEIRYFNLDSTSIYQQMKCPRSLK